ncbi:MAG: aminoacyl-tRNA hydrolase [Syntrophaceae bacterium]|nr:aminoacyl-tRNA hydrolase [Syntrophaceae bacterium]
MKLIVGLGNPGSKYLTTRHNIGFLALDKIAHNHDISITVKGFDACFGKGKIGDIPVLLLKPQTFMNVSGISVKKSADYFKIDLADLIVVHDDIDLSFGTLRIKSGGGHAGHKGLISIIEHLQSSEFVRVRIGIGKPSDTSTVEKFVLETFNDDEMNLLPSITMTASNAVRAIIVSGIQAAMNHHNYRALNQSAKEDDTVSQ